MTHGVGGVAAPAGATCPQSPGGDSGTDVNGGGSPGANGRHCGPGGGGMEVGSSTGVGGWDAAAQLGGWGGSGCLTCGAMDVEGIWTGSLTGAAPREPDELGGRGADGSAAGELGLGERTRCCMWPLWHSRPPNAFGYGGVYNTKWHKRFAISCAKDGFVVFINDWM